VQSPLLRTKDNADHAGPSPPLVLLKVPTSSPLEILFPSPSNNSSPAPLKTVDAMVDSWTTLSLTPDPTHWSLNPNTHTPLHGEELEPAPLPRLLVVSYLPPITLMSKNHPAPSSLLLPSDQLPLLLKPTRPHSSTTLVESLLDPLAEPLSTTVSLPSDGEPKVDKNTTLSRTPGDPHGENPDTSESELKTELVSAVSKCLPHTQPPTDDDVIIFILSNQIHVNINRIF